MQMRHIYCSIRIQFLSRPSEMGHYWVATGVVAHVSWAFTQFWHTCVYPVGFTPVVYTTVWNRDRLWPAMPR